MPFGFCDSHVLDVRKSNRTAAPPALDHAAANELTILFAMNRASIGGLDIQRRQML
jgi:hypothetical protein